MAPKGVILDIDGTLIDSNGFHAQAWVDALAEKGYRVRADEVIRLIGQGGDKVLPQLTGLSKDSPEGQELNERQGQIFKERYLRRVQGLPGAADLLRRMHAAGLRLAVATSAKDDMVDFLLAIVHGNDLIEKRTSSGDVSHSKPDPDIVQAALQRLKLPPGQVVMLGDTPWDVQAATKAGVPIIAVRSGGWESADLQGAVAVYDDPADLLAHYAGSPLDGAGPS